MRRATVRTTHDSPETIAAAIRPDNTDEMDTTVVENSLITQIERRSTGGLQTTVDDYLVNIQVAERTRSYSQTDTHTSKQDPETQQ